MKPLDFYRLGLSLAETAKSEAEQRTVVNRLYYGLHHEACCRYFRNNPDSEPVYASRRHSELRNQYTSHADERANTVGQRLHYLIELRRLADYQLAPPLSFRGQTLDPLEFMGMALEAGRQLLDALEDYSPGEAEDGCTCLVQF